MSSGEDTDSNHLEERAESLAETFKAERFSVDEGSNSVTLYFGDGDGVTFPKMKVESLTAQEFGPFSG